MTLRWEAFDGDRRDDIRVLGLDRWGRESFQVISRRDAVRLLDFIDAMDATDALECVEPWGASGLDYSASVSLVFVDGVPHLSVCHGPPLPFVASGLHRAMAHRVPARHAAKMHGISERTVRRQRARDGVGNGRDLYFIAGPVADDGSRMVKVGVSSSPERRLDQLRTGSAWPLEIIGIIRGHGNEERAWHERLGAYRREGEWFLLPEEVWSPMVVPATPFDNAASGVL
jgi:hypothetical protein